MEDNEYYEEPVDFVPLELDSSLPIGDLIQMYVQERDELTVKRREFKVFEAQKKDLLSRISMAMRDKADQLGVDSFKSEFGTAYRRVTKKYRVGNWPATLDFIIEHKFWQMLEKRVAKRATEEIHDEMGVVPPGIDFDVEVEFAVRRASKN